DLSITVAPTPMLVRVGKPLSFTVMVANSGPDDVTGDVVIFLSKPLLSLSAPGCMGSAPIRCSMVVPGNGVGVPIAISTLGRLALRLIEPSSGSIRFDGHDLLAAGAGQLRRLRRHMQIIFQDPFGSLNPRMRVHDILAEPALIHGSNGGPPPSKPAELLKVVGLDESAL